MTTVTSTTPHSLPKTKAPSTCHLLLKKAKEVLILALKIIILGALALWQGELFLAGLVLGFTAKCIWREKCTEAIRNIQEVIAKRPFFIGSVVIAGALIVPGSVLVIPPFLGGIYTGIKAAKFCLNTHLTQ